MVDNFIPHSFQTPNFYIDQVEAFLTPNEFKVLIYMVRKIFGWQKRQDRISLTQLQNGLFSRDGEQRDYGTGLSRPAIISALEGLKRARLVSQNEKGNLHQVASLFSLQLDLERVDFVYLKNRRGIKSQVSKIKMEQVRKGIELVNGIDQLPTSKPDLPELVNGIDCDWSIPLDTQNPGKPNQNNNSAELLLSLSFSLEGELSEDCASYFLEQIKKHGREKALGFFEYAYKNGFTWLKARNTNKKGNLIETWEVKPEEPKEVKRARLVYRVEAGQLEAYEVFTDGTEKICERENDIFYTYDRGYQTINHFPHNGDVVYSHDQTGKEQIDRFVVDHWETSDIPEGTIRQSDDYWKHKEVYRDGAWVKIPNEGECKYRDEDNRQAYGDFLIKKIGTLELSRFLTFHNDEWLQSTNDEVLRSFQSTKSKDLRLVISNGKVSWEKVDSRLEEQREWLAGLRT